MKAEKRRWRERRGEGWSQTVYEGLFLRSLYFAESAGYLVSNLSHGLRVMEIKDPNDFEFERASTTVEVPDTFVVAVERAFAADDHFQSQLPEYERAMGR